MVSAQSGQCGREREGQNPMGLQYSNRSGNISIRMSVQS